MILLNEFIFLKEYLGAVAADAIPRPERCIRCGGEKVWFVGWYKRFVNLLVAGGRRHREEIKIRRCRCARCGKSFGLLPAFLYPHRQFGPETTEAVVVELLKEPEARPGDYVGRDGLGPSAGTVRRYLSWLEENFDEALIQSAILSLEPSFPVERIRAVPIRGGTRKIRCLGGLKRCGRVSRVLGHLRAWHRAGRRHRRLSDRRALRSYLRWLFEANQGLVLYLTRVAGEA